ncbi:Nn.00g060730.m01.CDS01 [Neocucurbitaria sp. VM-36]
MADVEIDMSHVYNTLRKLALMRHIRDSHRRKCNRIDDKLYPVDPRKAGFYTENKTEDELEDESEVRVEYREVLLREMMHNEYLVKRITMSYRVLDDRLCDYISKCSPSQCYALCKQMQQKLPRKLRDMVYENILEPQARTVSPQDFHGPKEYPAGLVELDARGISHIYNIEAVGPATLLELAETYYRMSTLFSAGLGLPWTHHHLRELFRGNMWGPNLNLNPPNHIKCMVFHCYLMSPDDRSNTKGNSNVIFAEAKESLLKLDKGVKIDIFMVCYAWSTEGDLRAFLNSLSHSIPVLDRLLESGHRIIFQQGTSRGPEMKRDELTMECLEQMLRGLK